MTLYGLALRNAVRNKFRVGLTVVGVTVTVATFILLRTILWSWQSASQFAAKDRIVTRDKVTFVLPLPKNYIDVVRSTPHVRIATFANWFGGRDPNHEREFFATFAVDDATYFEVYTEAVVPAAERAAWMENRKGAIIGDGLAKKLGWKVGDRISLVSGLYPGDWLFDIEGIYRTTSRSIDRSTFVFHWNYLNDALSETNRDKIGWIASRIDDPSRTADISAAIDRVFDEKDTQTLSQDERSFQASFLASVSAVLGALDIVSVVIMIILTLVLGNTIAMGVRERTQEYGVLRALGFLPGHIASFIILEAAILGLMGGLLGVAVSYPLIERGLGLWLMENMGNFFPFFHINPPIAAVAIGLSIGLGVLAAAFPAYRASRLNVIDALRRVA